MRKQLRIFKILFKIGFLKLSKYIGATLVNCISSFIFISVQYFVWKEIMSNRISSDGYTFIQMLTYIIFSQILFHIYPHDIGGQLSNLIRSGNISIALTKPLPILRQMLYENIGVSAYRFLFISVPIFIVGMAISGFQLFVMKLCPFVLSILLSYLIYVYIDMLFGMMQFLTASSWGIHSLKYAVITLLSGRMLPLELYPKWCQKMIDVLPFHHLYDTPLGILIGESRGTFWNEILMELMWVGILYVLYQVFYRVAIKKVIVQGG